MGIEIGIPLLRGGHVRAAADWHRDDLIPDVLDNADAFEQPEALAHAIGRRFDATGRSIATLYSVDYPKMHTGVRPVPILDPLALHAYRAAITPIAANLERSLPVSTMSRRVLVGSEGAWCAAPWRKAIGQRRRIIAGWREADRKGGRGTYDMRSAFPTIDTQHLLSTTLPSLGCDEWQLSQLRRFLNEVAEYPGRWPGLLQTLEPSSVLGTAAMVSVDRLLASLDAVALRWVDDGFIATGTRGEFEHLAGCVDDHSQAVLRQSLNQGKTGWQPWTVTLKVAASLEQPHDEEFELFDPLIDFREVEEALADAAHAGNPEAVPAALSKLARTESLLGHDFICENPWVIERLPSECARHITHRNVWSLIGNERRDAWLSQCEPGSGSNKIFRLGLIHARRQDIAQLSPSLLIDAGLSLQSDDGAGVALGTEYLAAAAVASTTKGDQQRLIDLASRYPESNIQRALLGAFRPGSLSKARLRDVRNCVDRSPILEPIGARLGVR